MNNTNRQKKSQSKLVLTYPGICTAYLLMNGTICFVYYTTTNSHYLSIPQITYRTYWEFYFFEEPYKAPLDN